MVRNLRSGRFAYVPRARAGSGGLECGSKSSLANKRAQNDSTNLDEHVTGRDIVKLITLYDSPSFSLPDAFTIENATEFDCDDSFALGRALRSALQLRNVNSASNVQCGSENGGQSTRRRFYENENRACDELGPPRI